jgi:hypothetical protein
MNRSGGGWLPLSNSHKVNLSSKQDVSMSLCLDRVLGSGKVGQFGQRGAAASLRSTVASGSGDREGQRRRGHEQPDQAERHQLHADPPQQAEVPTGLRYRCRLVDWVSDMA